MHAYTDAARLGYVQVRDLLARIRDRASFQPPRADPDHKWWNEHVNDV